MTRTFACISAVLFSCCTVLAQSPAGSVPNGVTTTVSPEVQQFQTIENTWSKAVSNHDQYGLELVLSPLFMDVSAAGDITTRDQDIANLITTDDKLLYLTQKVITVRLMGDIAVVNGTYVLRHQVNGNEVTDKGVFTHVFERVRGNWLCVNAQRTALPQSANPKSKDKKSPSAELPFHIPIFGRSDKK